MGANSTIEWTDRTWNPLTGCTKISAGCKNCYAERMAKRLLAMGNPRYTNGFAVTLHEDLIDAPFKWKTPQFVFANSMSDIFHVDVPFDFIRRVFETMEKCPQHTFQVLTKRSDRVWELSGKLPWPANVWMGVSVESTAVVHRVYDLERVPAAVRFLSVEPLIGPAEGLPLRNIDWVIVGGESGPNARPMQPAWVESVYAQCRAAGTAFFFKQWGGKRKDLTGRELHGRTYDEMPIPRNVVLTGEV